jgi:hypothetical protein
MSLQATFGGPVRLDDVNLSTFVALARKMESPTGPISYEVNPVQGFSDRWKIEVNTKDARVMEQIVRVPENNEEWSLSYSTTDQWKGGEFVAYSAIRDSILTLIKKNLLATLLVTWA